MRPTGRVVVIPYRSNVSHFPFVAVILVVLGGFLWHPCRTCSIILEVHIFFFFFKSVEEEKPTLMMGHKSVSRNKICCDARDITVTLPKSIPELLVHVERKEIFPRISHRWMALFT